MRETLADAPDFEDGWTTLELSIEARGGAFERNLGLGADVIVLEPEELRRALAQAIAEMQDNYADLSWKDHDMRIKVMLALTALLAVASACDRGTTKTTSATPNVNRGADGSAIDPANFTTEVDNPYFPLIPGSRWEYEQKTEDGLERIEVVVTEEIKKTNTGVETVVVHDTVFLDDVIIEDTWDWYAQDKAGNVWYFGEDTHEFEDGRPINSSGSWEAGVDGARPGIYMKAEPKLGEGPYKQEMYKGKAEDTGEVVGLNKTETVPFGTFTGLVETEDLNPLEEGVVEHKFYAKGIGVVLEKVVEGGDERTELVEFEKG